MSASVRDKVIASGRLVSNIIDPALRPWRNFQDSDVPDLSGLEPGDAAKALRSAWQVGRGPIDDLTSTLECHGVRMFWFEEQATNVDAVSFWSQSTPFVLSSSRRRDGVRERFDVAHELGHLVLHRNQSDLAHSELESQAHHFAACFLMPADDFSQSIPIHPTVHTLLEEKKVWKVSLQAIIRRCYDLGFVSDRFYKHACMEVNTRGWRIEEPNPVKRESSVEQSRIFGEMKVSGISVERFAHSLNLSEEDLAAYIPCVWDYRSRGWDRMPDVFIPVQGIAPLEDNVDEPNDDDEADGDVK